MSATHAAKQEQIDLIKDRFSRATAAVLVDFRGLNVAKTTELRNAFRKAGVEYKVLKNTLIEKAVSGTPLEDAKFLANLVGQTGVAWTYEDPAAAAKIIRDFRKDEAVAARLAIGTPRCWRWPGWRPGWAASFSNTIEGTRPPSTSSSPRPWR